jgi:hypothetical protein
MDALNEVVQFFQNKGMEFFDKFTTDNEFFKFYCMEKNMVYMDMVLMTIKLRLSFASRH